MLAEPFRVAFLALAFEFRREIDHAKADKGNGNPEDKQRDNIVPQLHAV